MHGQSNDSASLVSLHVGGWEGQAGIRKEQGMERNVKMCAEVTGPVENNLEIITLEHPACARSTGRLGVPSPPGPQLSCHSPAPSHKALRGVSLQPEGCLYNRGQSHCRDCICLAFILLEVFAAIRAGNCNTPFQNRLLLER